MRRISLVLIIISQLFVLCSKKNQLFEFESDAFTISVNRQGTLKNFVDKNSRKNYLANNISAPLMSIRIQNEMFLPISAKLDENNQIIILSFQNERDAKIKVESKETHLTFELIEISDSENIELVVWGPYPTTIKKMIGETIGVVRGEKYALGIQALNIKTLGGYPWNENDHLPQMDIFESDDNYTIDKGRKGVLYSVEAAKPTQYGSTLQAYCRNRNKDRVINNWEHEKYVAPAYKDGGIIGSKIALFGCPVEKTLDTIGAIEIAEGLPHPQIDGQWGKTATSASAAYIILNFSEKDIEEALAITKKAGLRYLYHGDPFDTWGHFKLKNAYFPNGREGLKRCVEKAESMGIKIGVHTLSNFITPNDSYVTPIPDKRLAKIGTSVITQDIDSQQSEILVEAPDSFNQFKRNFLKTVLVGNELIRYDRVSEKAPWTLLECQRGAFGTTADSHKQGEKISKLADHGYNVFLTNSELSIEVARNIAELFNKTGLRQISFDGLEGNHSTGMGNYGEVLFTKTWYDSLNEEIKQHYIGDASRSGHFFWHIYTRMNWGEPWYAGFRESQTEYRLRNQKYFQRNFMPGMLGWFKMTSETSIEDIEWMLARSAAFSAGYAFVTDYKSIEENGHSEEILKFLGEWENARMANVFPEDQKQLMQDVKNEFSLKPQNETEWELVQIYSYKFKHEYEKQVKQPGEPASSTFSFENPAEKQPMNFILTSVGGIVQDIIFKIDNFEQIQLPITLQPGQSVKYSGGNKGIIYSKNWKKIREIDIDVDLFTISNGKHSLRFDCKFELNQEALIKLELRFLEKAEKMQRKDF
ncbi:hypothetical protein ACFLRX_03975 [Acidobacteriota bacterium]